jgi:hypothetical protein
MVVLAVLLLVAQVFPVDSEAAAAAAVTVPVVAVATPVVAVATVSAETAVEEVPSTAVQMLLTWLVYTLVMEM